MNFSLLTNAQHRDCSGGVFSYAKMQDVKARGVTLEKAVLESADCSGGAFASANMQGVVAP